MLINISNLCGFLGTSCIIVLMHFTISSLIEIKPAFLVLVLFIFRQIYFVLSLLSKLLRSFLAPSHVHRINFSSLSCLMEIALINTDYIELIMIIFKNYQDNWTVERFSKHQSANLFVTMLAVIFPIGYNRLLFYCLEFYLSIDFEIWSKLKLWP